MKSINCPICSKPLLIKMARGRTSNKPFIMMKCEIDGRHFRGFISDQHYISRLVQENKLNIPDQVSNDKGIG
jgi:hypothetical protein